MPALYVFEPEPNAAQPSGLLDQHGNKLYRPYQPNRIGFDICRPQQQPKTRA
jgi:hypothetical protein